MNFEELAWNYYEKFHKQPPIFSTLDIDNPEYLKMLKEAIDENRELTLDEIEEKVVIHENAQY